MQVKTPELVSQQLRCHLAAAALLIVALVVFIPNLHSYFLADDFVLLSWTHVPALANVFGFFSPATWWFYRPLVKLIYWLGQSLFGLQATPLHLCSLGFHGLSGFLVYYLLVGQLRVPWAAGLAGSLVFLLNPHQVETVSWIAAIGELVATSGSLGGLLCFQRFCAEGRARYWLASLALFTLALFARESGVLLPLLLVVDGLLFKRTTGWPGQRYLAVAGSYGTLTLGYLLLQLMGRNNSGATGIRGGLTFHLLNIDSILLGILDYVHGLLPGGSAITHLPLENLRVLIWVEWLLIAGIVAVLWRAGQRVLLYGLVWLLITPLLFIFFNAPAERYFYLPSIGYVILIAGALAGFSAWHAGWPPRAVRNARLLPAGVIAVLLLFQIRDLLSFEAAWIASAETSARIMNDLRQAVPDPHDYTAFYLVGIPATYNRAPLFLDGLEQAVELVYDDNRTLTATAVTCADLQQLQLPRYNFIFQYGRERLTLLADPASCH